ncbi:flavodoxin [Mycolicibacterium chubuense NBB4]|uniref:Flavodoxin n=1 Tax=Mycolicibacterium chubuense (strain NBB4) TaxID=710421 RepID=I4BFE1_MYCCN|nr:flavodoxin family protein [Mycolicibacterium chubuense]AFM15998.1 flavodoxin [Mycolicibacterium chubuense NBB4]
MKSLIVCVSISNGNTRRVADRIALELGAEVVEPEAVDVDSLGDYDLVGFGSGIYFFAVHPRLWRLIGRLPAAGKGARAFTFFTSGGAAPPLLDYAGPMRRRLERKGFDVVGSFSCRGVDLVGPLRRFGGINKGRPNAHDLELAGDFARCLRDRAHL